MTKRSHAAHEGRVGRFGVGFMLLALAAMMFYGLIVKVTFGNPTLFTLKTYIPEVCIALGLACLILPRANEASVSRLEMIFLLLLLLLGTVNLRSAESASAVMVVVRDIGVPLIVLVFLSKVALSQETFEFFEKWLVRLCALFVVSAIGLGILEAYMGTGWTARFYTGYLFWGTDPASRISINSNGSILRLPGPTGVSVKNGMFAVLSFIVFYGSSSLGKKSKIVLMALSFVVTVQYDSRTSILAIVAVLFLVVSERSDKKRLIIALGIILAAIVVAYLVVVESRLLFSVGERLFLWGEIASSGMVENLFLPLNVYEYSAFGGGEEGVALSTIFDNAYLYFGLSFGIVMLVLLIMVFVQFWRNIMVVSEQDPRLAIACKYLLIATFVMAFLVNLFNGRCWMTPFSIVFALCYAGCIQSPLGKRDEGSNA